LALIVMVGFMFGVIASPQARVRVRVQRSPEGSALAGLWTNAADPEIAVAAALEGR
jgi:hypothetical protein